MADEHSRKHKRLSLALGAIAVLAIGVIAATLMTSQALSNAAAQSNDADDEVNGKSTVSTSGTATTKVDPDKASVTVGVETDGATASDAVANNTELMNSVIEALKALGITDDQLSTGYFSVYPVYEYEYPPCILKEEGMIGGSNDTNVSTVQSEIYPPPPECQPKNVITGYRASNSLSVTLDGDADVGEVIDAAVEAGANSVSGAYFFVSQERQEQIREDLIEEAIANAESRANKAASAVDMNVTGVKSITLNDIYFPIFDGRLASAEAGIAGSTPILPGQQ